MLIKLLTLLSVFIFQSIGWCSQNWITYQSTPVLTGTSSTWDSGTVQEPDVKNINNTLVMAYHGSDLIGNDAIGFATSNDGLHYNKYVSNPVIGRGACGVSEATHHSMFIDTDGTIYIFYVDANTTGNLWRATIVYNGSTFVCSNPTEMITAASLPAGTNGNTNTNVIKKGSTYYLFDELSPGGIFKQYLFTGTDLTNWIISSNSPIPNLAIGSSNGSSGADIHLINGVYSMWYHGPTSGGDVPTDIYYATNPDLGINNWSQSNGIIISRSNEINLSNFSGGIIDQCADAMVVEFNGKTYIYYDRVNNSVFYSDISVKIYNGTMSQLISGISNKSTSNNVSIFNGSLN